MSTGKILNEIKIARQRSNHLKRTVPRGRLPNAEYRTREYLTEREVERLMKAAGNNRHGHRDATMILMAFRHGLRASELCSLRWEQVDLVHGRLHVHRLKNGMPSEWDAFRPSTDRHRTSRPAPSPARTKTRTISLVDFARLLALVAALKAPDDGVLALQARR
jgi:integrase